MRYEHLIEVPVGVLGNQGACVIAKSYEMKATGVGTGMPIWEALSGANATLCEADLGLARISEAAGQRTQLHLQVQEAEVERLAQGLILQAQAGLRAAGRELDHEQGRLAQEATRQVTGAAEGLECDLAAVAGGARALVEAARRGAEAHTRMVVGLGPQATLRRGFAIARDAEGRPVTSKGAAVRLPALQVEFHDGRVAVANRGHGGEGR